MEKIKIGFIDYYLDEWHANNYPAMFREQSGGTVEVTYAYGMIPSPKSKKTSEEWCKEQEVICCETIEEVVANSDALVVLAPDNPETHLMLAELPLKSGKRTYIDKTFAETKADAEAIFAIAKDYNTPCYSTSALRYAAEYERFLEQNVKAAAFMGPNVFEIYSIHLLEPMIMLMKGKVEKVMALKQEDWTQLLLQWTDGRIGSVICTGSGVPFEVTLKLDNRCEAIQVNSDYFGAFIKALVAFFQTGEGVVPHEETVEIIAVREAGLKAITCPGEWVNV